LSASMGDEAGKPRINGGDLVEYQSRVGRVVREALVDGSVVLVRQYRYNLKRLHNRVPGRDG
jgi:hypothetical protein